MEKLVGLILCGGQSSRMGQDKGLLKSDTQTWAEKLKALLERMGLQSTFISVAEHNYLAYKQQFKASDLILDQAFEHIPSPLVGILSAHQFLKQQGQACDLLVLACDLKNLQEEAIECVVKAYHTKQKEVYILTDGKYAQPLAGIYCYDALEKLLIHTQKTVNQHQSMRFLLTLLGTQMIKLPQALTDQLKNYNRPSDL